ncbi:MAG: sigma-54 dependent transcriptional regulator [Luteolibacter sp.]
MDILIIDDDPSISTATRVTVEQEDHYAETADSIKAARLRIREEKWDLIFLDVRLGEEDGLEFIKEILEKNPDQLVVIFTAYSSVEIAIKATQAGAFDYLEKPFTPDRVRGILLKAQKALTANREITNLKTTVTELKTQVDKSGPRTRFESDDPTMKATLEVIFRAAASQATILILGESGTGKSVIARTIHENSSLSNKPFVTVSCPSLSKELLESELFGHMRGAFTGAVKDQWGKVHAADGGTLFLDEIGELPLEIQPKLLRLLQEREYERLGENKPRTANVRIIAATNRDLKASVAAGEFREDLFYRINVISVEMPPLRARPKDLVGFAEDYLAYFASQIGREIRGFSAKALDRLRTYSWPGNLRELRNSIERATILSKGAEIEESDLPSGSGKTSSAANTSHIVPGSDVTLEQLEEEHIRLIVDRVKNLQDAAAQLGIDKATLYRKRKKYNLT